MRPQVLVCRVATLLAMTAAFGAATTTTTTTCACACAIAVTAARSGELGASTP